MANRIPWAGVFSPETVSRAAIDKAIKAAEKKDKVKVGYATWTNGTPFFAAMADTIKAECEKYGYEFTMVVSDGDINKQVANIESLVTMGVDVIIDCDYSVEAELAAVKSAVAAGIPVIGLGLPFPDNSPVITTAATNYYEQGFLVGQLAAQQYKDTDVKCATIPGMIGHTIAESKLNGFIGGFVYERAIQLGKPFATKEDAMLYGYNLEQQIVKSAKFSDADLKFDVVASIDGFWAQDTGMKAMEDILTAHPDVNLVFTDNDQEGFGAIKAMQQAGYKVGTEIKIVSVGDGTKQAMQLIKDGTYLGITLASPYTWAKACTDLVHKIYAEGFDATNLPGCVYLENVLVTKDNVDKYMPTQEFTTLSDAVFTPIGK
jgi:ribose transport system substrate-binding protein